MNSNLREIKLTNEEIIRLDGKVNPEAQKIIDYVLNINKYKDIGSNFMAELIVNSLENGIINKTHRNIDQCQLCNKICGYKIYKSGYRKGKPNYDKPIRLYGVCYNDGFCIITGYSKFGICNECFNDFDSKIINYILEKNLKIEIRNDDRTKYIKEEARYCKACKKIIWEFDMGLAPTLFDNGYYYNFCPICNGINWDCTKDFRLVKKEELNKIKNCWKRKLNDL